MTVGSGISPDLLTPSRMNAGSGARGLPESHRDTAGGEFRPALKTLVLAGANGRIVEPVL